MIVECGNGGLSMLLRNIPEKSDVKNARLVENRRLCGLDQYLLYAKMMFASYSQRVERAKVVGCLLPCLRDPQKR